MPLRFPVGSVTESWKNRSDLSGVISAARTQAPSQLHSASLPPQLSMPLQQGLAKRGIRELYSHQRRAFDLADREIDLCIATPTSSGKSYCYNLPVLQCLASDSEARAFYIFPTKALAQDQLAGLHSFLEDCSTEVPAGVYDGDTPAGIRAPLRKRGNIILTNPDMLHSGILPQHTHWARFFEKLRYIVLDEVHTYRGVFGSHVANVIRRLHRVARFYGSNPTFICCSATIANPDTFVSTLIGRKVEVILESGAPSGQRDFLLLNPPVINKELGLRASSIKLARKLTMDLYRNQVPTIVFAKSRLTVELFVKGLREAVVREGGNPFEVQGYRGGYLPGRRRNTEKSLRSGQTKVVVTTNALELGIDLGELEACIILGYPGTIASVLQQSGRAGRRGALSVTALVGRSTPIDQYVQQNPDFLFGSPVEHARINPDNLMILIEHLKCAIFELPYDSHEQFGNFSEEDLEFLFQQLENARFVHRSGKRAYWIGPDFPASSVSLRNLPGENFVVLERGTGEVLAEVDEDSAPTTLHTHAIYNLDGKQFIVEELDWENRKAHVSPVEGDYYTDAMTYTEIVELDAENTQESKGLTFSHGELSITNRVTGFKKIRFETNENIGYGDVHLPESSLHTTSFWITVPQRIVFPEGVEPVTFQDAVWGVGHALRFSALIALMCEENDLALHVGFPERTGLLRPPLHRPVPESHHGDKIFDPTLFLYDSVTGGIGLSNSVYEQKMEIFKRADDMITKCPCPHGCPTCLGPIHGQNERSKDTPLRILNAMMSALAGGAL